MTTFGPYAGRLIAILILATSAGCNDDSESKQQSSPTATPTEIRPTVTPSATLVMTAAATSTSTPTLTRSAAQPSATTTPSSCDIANPCRVGQLCELAVGTCASDFDSGTCVDVPFACFDAIDPVCGCDGLTYSNDCVRRAARAQKSADGPCSATECGDDCDCYATRTFATSCPLECATCDSYWACEGSRCLEHCGPIPPDRCAALCSDNDQCLREAFCGKPVARCNGPGACRARPQTCPDVEAPVCGCDGRTYSNECFAESAGVALAHRGACEQGLIRTGFSGT